MAAVVPFGSRYVLVKKLAAGQISELFLANFCGVGGIERQVAIKRLREPFAANAELVRVFLDEARVIAALNHPNVVQIFDVDTVDGRPYFAMEYVHGENLAEVIRHGQELKHPLPLNHGVKVASRVCGALDHAHSRCDGRGNPLGIIHRNVCPANIMVTYDGGVKLIDFGYARAVIRTSRTQPGLAEGALAYMAPEVLEGRLITPRSDIYAVGVVLYELTTLRPLFRGAEALARRRILSGTFPRPSEVSPGYPPELEAIVLRAMARDQADRYPDALAMRSDLEDFLIGHRLVSGSLHIARHLRDLFGVLGPAIRLPAGAPPPPGSRPRAELIIIDDTEETGEEERTWPEPDPPVGGGGS